MLVHLDHVARIIKNTECWPIAGNPYCSCRNILRFRVRDNDIHHSSYRIVGRLYVRITYSLGASSSNNLVSGCSEVTGTHLSESLTVEPKQPNFERIKVTV